MRNIAVQLSAVWVVLATSQVSIGCSKSQAQAPAPFPPQAPGAQAPGFSGGAAQPTLVSAPAAAPAAALSQPNPLALPCQSDAQCLTHRCNVAAGKCAWPCQTDTDCMPGSACIAPTCLPKLQ